ncbi:MAG: iron chelate uptake ABC transporter family permease subunit [Steroidobacteraceae bacterium]
MLSGFMVNTWIVATLVAAVAGFVGFFVVIRRSSFAAHALPLAAFPGAAAATLLGVSELLGLVVFAGLGVVGISQLARAERQEVATALCLVTLLALGTLFLSMTREYSQGIYALLFGEVLGISTSQILPVAVMSVIAIGAMTLSFRPLLLDAISPELAATLGVSHRLWELQFLTVLALSTAMVLPVVGALLVFSLMVGPASAARSVTDRPVVSALLSICISIATVWVAIALSYLSNWPVGFFVGALGVISYLSGRLYRRSSASIRGRRREWKEAARPTLEP